MHALPANVENWTVAELVAFLANAEPEAEAAILAEIGRKVRAARGEQ